MTRKLIDIPSRLIFQNSIDFVKNLRALKPHQEFEFDFSNLNTIDPFSLLLVSSEIQRCRIRFEESKAKEIANVITTSEIDDSDFKSKSKPSKSSMGLMNKK